MRYQARLCSLRSPEMDIRIEYPSDSTNFIVLLEAEIGAVGIEGSTLFRFDVCTPSWVSTSIADTGSMWGKATLIVEEWNYENIHGVVATLCERTTSDSWQGIVQQLTPFATSEFST